MSTTPPEDKKGMSTGAIVGLVLLALVIIGGGICGVIISGFGG